MFSHDERCAVWSGGWGLGLEQVELQISLLLAKLELEVARTEVNALL